METIKLHYAKLNLDGDIPCYKFNTNDELMSFIDSIIYPVKLNSDRVYLLSMGDEIFISEEPFSIFEVIKLMFNPSGIVSVFTNEDIFLQEYPSYEDAYKVALDMKEGSALCYNN